MNSLIGALLIGGAAILQVTLVGRITLLQGPADVVLLTLIAWNLLEGVRPDWRMGLWAGLILSLSSALPFWVLLLSYGLSAALVQYLRNRVWQIPLLTLFTATVAGTLMVDLSTLAYLWLNANPLDFAQALNFVLLPRIVFNMLLALPVYTLIGEISKLFLPDEVAA